MRQWALSLTIKHPLGRVPVSCQLLTLLTPHPVREVMLIDLLKDTLSYCTVNDVFVDLLDHAPIVNALLPFPLKAPAAFIVCTPLAIWWQTRTTICASQRREVLKSERVRLCEHVVDEAMEEGFGSVAGRCNMAEVGGHWQCQDVETDEDLEESSTPEREVVGGLQCCSSCP